MGDQHDGQPQAFIDVAQQAKDRLGALRVEGRGRFTAQQDFGLQHQRPGDPDTLFLPARNDSFSVSHGALATKVRNPVRSGLCSGSG